MDDLYIVVCWPESQDLMDKDWFDECELINSHFGHQKYGGSAYFVPEARYRTITPYDTGEEFLNHRLANDDTTGLQS